MIRLLIWILLGYVVYLIFKGRGEKKDLPKGPEPGAEAHRDPVCGVYVSEEDAVIGRIEEKRLYFCSMECLEKYREELTHKS